MPFTCSTMREGCGRSGKRLRDCHFGQIKDLNGKISRKDAERSFNMLTEAGASAFEMAEPTVEPITSSPQARTRVPRRLRPSE